MVGYSVVFIPRSFKLGKFKVRQKTLWAFGPFRFCIHRGLTADFKKE